MRKGLRSLLLAGLAAGLAGPSWAADPATIDWSKVPATTVTLFYPGQSSYEWLRSPDHKKAQKETVEGQACSTCHKGEEKTLGAKLVKEGPLEPTPVKDKVGSIDLGLQVAYDATNAYIRYQWKTQNPYPGDEHQYLRFDGKGWKVYGFPKLDQVVQEGQQPGVYEDRITIMIDDGKVPMFAQQGCWLSCHDGQRDMANGFTKEEVAANPLLKAIKKSDVRKYLPATRTDPKDWKTGKSMADIDALKASGGFVDLIQWRAHRSGPVGMADDGYVLEFRNGDAGKDPFGDNADGATHQPKFMWDEKKVGYKSITADQMRKAPHILIKDQNAVPFDPNAGWKEGDMVPDYVLSKADAAGSAADNKAISEWKDGKWTVVIVRPLNLANADDKALKEGGVYNVGFAIHDDNITTRGHHVSFVKTLGFGAKADIEATKLP
jgi:ethylbenzene dehydrogenase